MREMLSMMGGLGSLLGNVFEHMEIMEQEQIVAMEQYPDRAEVIYAMFNKFTDMSALIADNGLSNKLFRHHVAEVLQRVGQNQPKGILDLGTTTEIALAGYFGSLKFPLSTDGCLVYQEAWIEIFGEKAFQALYEKGNLGEMTWRESWEGATREFSNEIRRKCKVDRNVPSKAELAERRAEALRDGTHLKWMDYQGVEPVQIDLFQEVTA